MQGTECKGSIAFIAAPYGYGPSSKAIAISSHLPRSIRRVFLGYGPALHLARSSKEFSSCIELNFNSRRECIAKLTAPYDVLIFVNTTRFISTPVTVGRPTILVETLAWLRDKPPSCASLLSVYFAQQFFHHPFSHELDALCNFTVVGAILPSSILAVMSSENTSTPTLKSPLVHCGGLFSPAMVTNADLDFVTRTLDILNTLDEPVRVILPQYLHSRFQPHITGKITLLKCSPSTIHEQIIGSEFCLTTTGIEFTYECMALGIPILFLPPFNASQHHQLEYHRHSLAESVPFRVDANLAEAGFLALSESTTSLQKTGMSERWPVQFAETSHFLDRLRTSEKAPLLRTVRDRQREVIDGVGSDGAQAVALWVVRELGLGMTLG